MRDDFILGRTLGRDKEVIVFNLKVIYICIERATSTIGSYD